MGKKVTDFVIETNGQCFLCLNSVALPIPPDKLELNSLTETSPNTSRSIQSLSRYLKLDMRKVFIGDGPISSNLLTKVRKSKLKVELCEDCVTINDKFSDLCLQLEKIKMEMNARIQLIHLKLDKEGEINMIGDSQPINEMQKLFIQRKVEIVESIRKEASKKCSRKLEKFYPRVRINKLTKAQENEIKLQVQRNRRRKNKLSQQKQFKTLHGSVDLEIIAPPHPNIKSEPVSATSSPDSDFDEDNNLDSPYEPPSSGTSDDGSELSHNLGIGPCQPKKEPIDEGTATGSNPVFPTALPKNHRQTERSLKDKCSIDSKSNQHTCRDCLRKFTSFPAFYLHYKAEHLKIIYTCSICNYKCKQIGNFNRHQKVSHKGTTYKCRDCNQVFSLESNLVKHKGSTGCMDRDTVERSDLAIVRPVKPATHSKKIQSMCVRISSIGKFRCKLCKKDLGSMDAFRTHYRVFHLKVKYNCVPCQREFSRHSTYTTHYATVHKAFKCPKCNKVFSRKGHLAKHLEMPTCDSDQRYKCKVCSREFASTSGVTVHHKKVHLGIIGSFKCDYCEKVFQNKNHRNRHHRNSHGTVKKDSGVKSIQSNESNIAQNVRSLKLSPATSTSSH